MIRKIKYQRLISELKDYKNLKMILQSVFATPSQFKLNNIINHINFKNIK